MITHGFAPPITSWFGDIPSTDLLPFDSDGAYDERAYREGAGLFVSWKSTALPGTYFQIYINGRFVWEGTDRSAELAYAVPSGERIIIDVGTVGKANRGVDYSATFTHAGNRANLKWSGGRYLDESLAGFHVYQSRTPGTAYDPTNRVANVVAAPGGQWNDGWGEGGWGEGGWGRSEIRYSWTSGHLWSGVWEFAIAAYDSAGNEDPDPPTWQVTIVVPPPGPVARPDGKRLWVQGYDAPTNVYTLEWIMPS
jgi:hypothetical protein